MSTLKSDFGNPFHFDVGDRALAELDELISRIHEIIRRANMTRQQIDAAADEIIKEIVDPELERLRRSAYDFHRIGDRRIIENGWEYAARRCRIEARPLSAPEKAESGEALTMESARAHYRLINGHDAPGIPGRMETALPSP